ncbi:hypothetical protein BS17DRAFT_791584 [Gyrodon lividus]|nr:hypothetical protein BS17DRAFT_791584 [Gyrodon lividus]
MEVLPERWRLMYDERKSFGIVWQHWGLNTRSSGSAGRLLGLLLVRVLSRNSRIVRSCGGGGVLWGFLRGVGGVRNCGFSLCAAPLYEFGSLI